MNNLVPDFEDRAAVVRVLSHWWTLNHRFFDYQTPHPIYHLFSRYPGIRCFRELYDQLICYLYCQVHNFNLDGFFRNLNVANNFL